MSTDCTTPQLVHTETPQCSPVHEMTEHELQQASVAVADSPQKKLVLTVAYKYDPSFSTSKKAPYVKKIVENGKVIVDNEKKETKKMKKMKKFHSRKNATNRTFLGHLPTGQRLVLYNCPMRSPVHDSTGGTDTETEC